MPTFAPRPPVYTPEKTERREHTPQGPGSGGRPPYRKRTGGGGDGDGEERSRRNERGPGERLRRSRPIMLFFLIGDAAAFLSLVTLFFSSKGAWHFEHNMAVNSWHAIPLPPILWLNTAILILSSVTMEQARRHIFQEDDVMDEWLGLGKPAGRRAMPWLLATCGLGLLFLAGQWRAWSQLATRSGYQAIYQNAGASRSCFNLFTGFHAAHLVAGLIALSICAGMLIYSRSIETRQVWLDSVSWYWHCMGIFWVGLFALLIWAQ
jgi:cytochrome c oxidase subunit 3